MEEEHLDIKDCKVVLKQLECVQQITASITEEEFKLTTDKECDIVCENSKAHKFFHNTRKPYKCNSCDYASKYLSTLNRHKKCVHNEEKQLKCGVCGYVCRDLGHLYTHTFVHSTENLYRCYVCNFTCGQLSEINKHALVHDEEKLYKCKGCVYTCKELHLLKNHRCFHRKRRMEEEYLDIKDCKVVLDQPESAQQNTASTTDTENLKLTMSKKCDNVCKNSKVSKFLHNKRKPKPYKCNSCDYSTIHFSILNRHKKCVHKEEKQLKCGDCGYVCRDLNVFYKHTLVHSTENLYKCDVCNFTCSQLIEINKHALVHDEENSYKCKRCVYTCNELYLLKNHRCSHKKKMEEEYIDIKDCKVVLTQPDDECAKQIAASTTEEEFKLTTTRSNKKCDNVGESSKALKLFHNKRKPYKCNICDYATKDLSTFNRHKKRVHKQEKQLKCGVCRYVCRDLNVLYKHTLVHSTENLFKCDVCHFTCGQLSDLNIHKLGHNVEMPYKRNVHSDEKPHKPSVCGYVCNQLDKFLELEVGHTLHGCIDCEFYTKSLPTLRQHLLLHVASN